MTNKSFGRWAAFGCIKGPSRAGKSEIPASRYLDVALKPRSLAFAMWPNPCGMSLSTDTPTVLWTLRNGHRRLECSVQLLPHGLQLHLALNGDTP